MTETSSPEAALPEDTSASSVTVPGTGQKMKANRFFYKGQMRALLTLCLVNLVFSVCSLGIYLPWAVANIRTYLASQMVLNKKYPLVYIGKPQQFLAGLGAALGTFIVLLAAFHFTQKLGVGFLAFLVILAGYAAFYAFVYASIYHRLNNLKLYTANFRLEQRIVEYALLAVKRGLLNLVSGGYTIPESDRQKWDFLMRHLSLGNEKFAANTGTIDVKSLQWVNMVSLWLPLLPAVVIVMMMSTIPPGAAAEAQSSFLSIMLYTIAFFGFIGRSTYRAALWSLRMNRLRLGPLRFKNMKSVKDLSRLKAGNSFLLLVTLGLAHPFTLQRTMKVTADALMIGGDPETLFRP